MMTFAQSEFVFSAYALAAIAIAGLIFFVAADHRAQLRALSRLKDKGAAPGHGQN